MVLISSVSFANYLNNSVDGVLSTVRSYNYEGKQFDKEYFIKQKAQQQARFNSFFFPQKINNTFFATADECATAEELTVNIDGTCAITTSGNFEDATLSSGFSACDEWNLAVKDVWYKFTAKETAHVISFTEEQETYSVYLQLYDMSACETPEDALYCDQKIVANDLVIGNEYLVRVFMVDTYGGPESKFQLCVRTLNAPGNDECGKAITLPVNTDGTCALTTEGTFQDATVAQNAPGACDEWTLINQDVWYEFTATASEHVISVDSPEDYYQIYIQVFSGDVCKDSSVKSIVCSAYATLPTNLSVSVSNLVPGEIYKIRVFSTEKISSNFNICVRELNIPVNDDCADAIKLPVSSEGDCESVEGTLRDASLSQGASQGCDPYDKPQKDVWYQFEALEATQGISLKNIENANGLYIEVYEEDICTKYVEPILCKSKEAGQETIELLLENLTPGAVYKIRVYASSESNDTDFEICVASLAKSIHVTNDEYQVPELVKKVLIGALGDCTGVENIDWVTGSDFGDVNGIAYFEKGESDFPFEKGIVLATRNALYSDGILGKYGDSPQISGDIIWPDDKQLTDYTNNALGKEDFFNNATVLEFDFTPVSDKLKFNFIFASNEYGKHQCEFSDTFAFFLTDTETGITNNLAIVPGTNDPISVVTIRKEEHSPSDATCGDENPEYFDTLYDSEYNGQSPWANSIAYKGRTIPMTAESEVVPGKTYHIKMVIQDRLDTNRDSAVFLEGESFDIGSIDLGEGLTFENGKALCFGNTHTLDAKLDEAMFNFEWYKDDVLISGATKPLYTVTQAGTYKVIARLKNLDCSLESSIDIDIYPDLDKVIKAPKALITCGNIPTIDLTESEQEMIAGIEGDYTFEYYPSLKDLQNGTNVFSNPVEYPFDGNATTVFIKVIAFGENSCYAIKELTIDVVPVMPPMEIDDVYSCNGYKLPVLPEGQRYFTGSAATGEELHAGDILREGTYTLYVYSESGDCYEEHEFQVIVENCIIPKGISPNGDGLNDSFDLTDYYPTSVKIYNRYGTMVYEYGSGYTSEWYGQDKSGKELPTGTYFYKFTTETGEFSGYVYLTREIK